MDEFIREIRKMTSSRSKNETLAFEYIVRMNMMKDYVVKHTKEAEHDDLDEDFEEESYDQETSKMPKQLVPGNIYIFVYQPNVVTKAVDFTKSESFKYQDRMPLVLTTEVNSTSLKGINLNVCPMALRACVINELCNIDPQYFNSLALNKSLSNTNPLSNKISRFFSGNSGSKEFLHMISQKYKIKSADLVFRTYSISKIRKIKILEPWTWEYIPFLNYSGMRNEYLKVMWKYVR